MNILVLAVIRCESTITKYTNRGQQIAAASTSIEYRCRLFLLPDLNDISPLIIMKKIIRQ